jgi:choline-sulfatase
VPLIVHSPTRFAPGRVAQPVSLVDVLPTLVELMGESAPQPVDPLPGRSLLDLCRDPSGTATEPVEREVIGEYMGEGAIAPIVMIRRGDLKFVHSPVDPDQLYDLGADPDERVNLAEDSDWGARVKEMRQEVGRRWDLDEVHADVLHDQARRRLIWHALRQGTPTPWEYNPPYDGRQLYMRNHLDLNEVERSSRFPRVVDVPDQFLDPQPHHDAV